MFSPIATFRSPFNSKFGVPRQAGVVQHIEGRIIFNEEYRSETALRGIDQFDYLWLIWHFSANKHAAASLSVRPPRLGGNKHLGVFATRSPYRPNPIGLSSVRLDHIDYHCEEAPVIVVRGADLMDGTPILDIKPYIPYTDAHPNAHGGFTDAMPWQQLDVVVPRHLQAHITPTLRQVLAQDPRPQYHSDPNRIYGMPYNGYDVHFRVDGGALFVTDITKL